MSIQRLPLQPLTGKGDLAAMEKLEKTLSRFRLPTIDSCRHRVAVDSDHATCGLIASLIGDAHAEIDVAACTACCDSFPPHQNRLNPVVASIVYSRASKRISAGGLSFEDESSLSAVKTRAQDRLPLVHDQQSRLTLRNRSKDPQQVDDLMMSSPMSLADLIPRPDQRYGRRVANWSVGITTAPRREPTIGDCLDSVIRAGWESPHLFVDGAMRLPERANDLTVTWRDTPIGITPAWFSGLRELIYENPSADAYVMLQDDIVLHDRECLREYLEDVLWPDENPLLISLYNPTRKTEGGWRSSANYWAWSGQGFIFSPAAAKALAGDADTLKSCMACSSEYHVPMPEVLQEWVVQHGLSVWYPTPSLAQHIGNTSTVWMDAAIEDSRRAHWFTGSIDAPIAEEESMDAFCEYRFECKGNVAAYEQRVDQGRQRMSELRVAICGLCRDVRAYLPRTAARIQRLGEMFADYRVVLFENDSADNTLTFLKDWQRKNDRVHILSERAGETKLAKTRSPARGAKMAEYRNRCHQYVLDHFSDVDVAIVVDTDLAGGWSYEGIAHTFGSNDWDFVGSYGLTEFTRRDPFPFHHYDVWAFRPAVGTEARKMVDHNKLKLNRGDEMIPVESCFGGLGIYTIDSFRAGKYGGGDCEHVLFHDQLIEAGFDRLFMNPNQIVLYSPI